MHAIDRFDNKSHSKRDTIGVWGDGNVGFITSLILKKKYPKELFDNYDYDNGNWIMKKRK